MLVSKNWVFGIGMCLLAGAAYGAETVVAVPTVEAPAAPAAAVGATSTATSQSTGSSLSNTIAFTVDSRFFGPSIGNPAALRPNLKTGALDPKSQLKTEDKVTFLYKLNGDQSIGMSAEADIYPVVDHRFVLKDPSLVFKASRVINGPVFSFDTLTRAYLPLGEVSQANKQVLAIRFEGTPKWKIPGSRFTVSSYGYINRLFYKGEGKGMKDYKFNLLPEVSYKVSPTLTAALTYKMWAYHLVGKGLTEMDNDVTYLSPGISWQPVANLTVNPYIDFSTGTKVTWDTTTLGVYLWWGLI